MSADKVSVHKGIVCRQSVCNGDVSRQIFSGPIFSRQTVNRQIVGKQIVSACTDGNGRHIELEVVSSNPDTATLPCMRQTNLLTSDKLFCLNLEIETSLASL
jgi:hypothetical protein